jgi:hypothetical protein
MMFNTGPAFQAIKDLALRYEQGEDIVLGCHCKPLACHGDIVKACVLWAHKEWGIG